MSNGITTLILIIINVIVSYKGFTNILFFEKYLFKIDRMLYNKEYIRLISSGFLHLDWIHLIFNMVTLYLFGEFLEIIVGIPGFLIIYFISLIGGNLFSLYVHRNHSDYSAAGASGAVFGVMFASIALSPGMYLKSFFFPIPMAGWLYGLLYLLYTIYGIQKKRSDVAHDAHFGGALAGMIISITLVPSALFENYITIALLTIPSVVFIYFVLSRPHLLVFDMSFFGDNKKYYTIDDKYNEERVNKQQEVDRILEKISNKGIGSLTTKERKTLEEYSKS